jgi:hypothetical protein
LTHVDAAAIDVMRKDEVVAPSEIEPLVVASLDAIVESSERVSVLLDESPCCVDVSGDGDCVPLVVGTGGTNMLVVGEARVTVDAGDATIASFTVVAAVGTRVADSAIVDASVTAVTCTSLLCNVDVVAATVTGLVLDVAAVVTWWVFDVAAAVTW